ncbi:MAG: hypothetical protein JXA13_06665 [Anaerolineales bacterium]|nr:hypothetical protein [Anaerolineales bacterium]
MKQIRLPILVLVLVFTLACTIGQTPPGQHEYGDEAYDEVETAAPREAEPGPVGISPLPPGPPPSGDALPAESLAYIGAFRLPGGEERPKTFAYGGNAMTLNPDGDPSGGVDGFPGSLFVMGHERIAYGDLPDGNQIAEVTIPAPVISRNIEELNTAEFVQDFHNVMSGYFTNLEEIPRVGMAYLDYPGTGPKIHIAWGQHLQEPGDPSHGWFNPDLGNPDVQGFWFIGDQNPYSTTGYMFEIPAEWANTYVGGRYIATGRMRDGGMSGMGPALFAYTPWQVDGSPPVSGVHLQEIPLLLYENTYNTEDIVRSLSGYQHPDEWEGGAWITTASGKQAVVFAGTKSTGVKYWYGYMHPDGPQYVCVDDHVDAGEITCRNADGSLCPEQGCCNEGAGTCISNRGWWSTRFDAQLILYDPNDFARVARGEMEPWQPQPYAVIDIDEHLYLNPPEWDEVDIGWGDQRRNRIGDVSFDRANGLLYVLEFYADGAKPVVHVWKVH